jgi:hypothetical protein
VVCLERWKCQTAFCPCTNNVAVPIFKPTGPNLLTAKANKVC